MDIYDKIFDAVAKGKTVLVIIDFKEANVFRNAGHHKMRLITQEKCLYTHRNWSDGGFVTSCFSQYKANGDLDLKLTERGMRLWDIGKELIIKFQVLD